MSGQVRAHLEAGIAARLERHQAGAPFDMDALQRELLDELDGLGLRVEDFACGYLYFRLDDSQTPLSLVIQEFDERSGPYQRHLEFESLRAARGEVLKRVLPLMKNYGALADVAWPPRAEGRRRKWWFF